MNEISEQMIIMRSHWRISNSGIRQSECFRVVNMVVLCENDCSREEVKRLHSLGASRVSICVVLRTGLGWWQCGWKGKKRHKKRLQR